MSQHVATEQPDIKKCESNSNLDISTSSNSSKINATVDLSCNKSINSEIVEAGIQQPEVTQLLNGASTVADAEPGIKPLTDIVVNLEDIKPSIMLLYYINFI